ncbi:nucleotide exchange factor GrpE [Weissella minor]|uniref:nucleotide exchange factor GrpE n=1 Tax=Weissella minor TaxID=1620 RepID=UPI001BAEF937|nr:nucleotide exchange factor GrpE [Weissella minor]MBS0949764.1 nucleotide exchange factor GrpE [Weissella minor]
MAEDTQATNEEVDVEEVSAEMVDESISNDDADQTESVTEADSETETVADEIADLRQQLSDAEDKFLRSQAEMQNMQTRLVKEQAQALKYANQKLGLAVLPALDNLERALQVEADDEAAEQLKKGVEMVFTTLKQALVDNGIKEVGVVGETFDPNFAQAIQSVPADEAHPADTIASVMQKGYVLDDRVIRPAMVSVYS